MSQWFYALDMLQHGPVTAQELAALHASGEIDDATQVWRDGLPDWQPLAAHYAELGLANVAAVSADAPPPPPPAPAVGAAPGPAPVQASTPSTPYAPPRSAPASEMDFALNPAAPVVYAGLLRRWAALVIDSIIIGVTLGGLLLVGMLVFGRIGGGNDMETAAAIAQGLYYLLYLIVAPIYYAGQESSVHQATFGKRVIGIKVCDAQGRRIGFAHALGRWAAAAISYLTLYIGFLMAAFTERKQALHDYIASTLVVDRWAYTAHPERQKTGATGCLVVALVVLLPGIVVLGILLAIAIPAYSDYTGRAKLSELMSEAAPVKAAVSEYVISQDRCPQEWDEIGMPAPTNNMLSDAAIGADQSGACVIQFTVSAIDGISDSAGKRIWFSLEGDSAWECSSDLPPRVLPSHCR